MILKQEIRRVEE